MRVIAVDTLAVAAGLAVFSAAHAGVLVPVPQVPGSQETGVTGINSSGVRPA